MRVSRSLAGATIVALGAVLFGATPASAATNTVCAAGCDYSTITAAVSAAAAGDTISIEAGTYPENSILVDKPLTLVGAGAGETIVDGENLTNYARAGVFNVRVPATGTGAITISGLTITNAGRTGTGTTKFGISMSSPQAATSISAVTFDDIEIVGIGNRDYGIYATGGQVSAANPVPRQVPPLTVSNSTISGTAYNGVGADTWNGDLLIANNELSESTTNTSAVLIMNEYTAGRMTGANVIRDNTSTGRLVSLRNDVGPSYGGYDSFTATNNTITGLTVFDFGIQVATNATSDAAFSRIGTATITGNTITGDGFATGTRGVLIRGLVENSYVNENNITGVGVGILAFRDRGQGAEKVEANRNRLFANELGIENRDTAATVDANDNWWGCTEGPSPVALPSDLPANEYCSPKKNTGTGTVTTDRWISALASAASPVLPSGTSTTVTGQFGALNDGTTVTLPAFFEGLDVAFEADNGSVAPSTGVLDPALASATTYTAAAVGSDEVRVTIDRADFPGAPAGGTRLHYGIPVVLGEPIPVAIAVEPALVAPVITSGAPTAATVDTAYSFQVTASGNPAPTFTISSGTLPTGLTMDANGLITGTPTAAGVFIFAITASNGTNPDATTTYTINVASAGLANTGANGTAPLVFGGILTLLIGAGLTFVSRSRRLIKPTM